MGADETCENSDRNAMTPDTSAHAPATGTLTALRTLRRIATFLRPYQRQVVGAAIALVIAASAVLMLGQGLRAVVDRGFTTGDASQLDRGLALLLVVIVVMALATFTRVYYVSWLGERVAADLRRTMFDHLLGLSPAFFEVQADGAG